VTNNTEYVWVVTYDHLEEQKANVFGPAGAREEDLARCIQPFRLYDDDGELYYSGRMSVECDFEPLDDYGTPNSGATRIDILNDNGEWETL
jgi:hypothetical protein